MIRCILAVTAAALLAGCASTGPGTVQAAAAKDDALDCATRWLAARDYEVRRADESGLVLEAESRTAYWPDAAIREIITASLEHRPGAAPLLHVRVRAFEYRASDHSLPVQRQTVAEIRPSAEVAADGRRLLEACSAHGAAGPTVPAGAIPTR